MLLVCSLAYVITQWSGIATAGSPTLTRQIEQRDQNGNVIARFVGEPKRQRGLYMTVSAVARWKAPLGLFAARKILPANVRAVVSQVQAAGVPIAGGSYDDQMRAMRWLVDYFTSDDNNFTYSLDAPDGDGRNNLSIINDFLDPETGHAGYCQHYASALAILGRARACPPAWCSATTPASARATMTATIRSNPSNCTHGLKPISTA